MNFRRIQILGAIVLVFGLLPSILQAQRVVDIKVDTATCKRDSVRFGIGYTAENELVVVDATTSLSHAERTFLPDGVPCPPHGCSYQSPVTFSGFSDTARIRSVEDINFVRVNIEHSWVGDLYINITCPNGQRASLMNYGGSGSTECRSLIPANHIGWSSGSNIATSTFLGKAYDNEGGDDCDSTLSGNAPGIGWNYCWSSNTGNGYQYAPGDGIIYRNGNQHDGSIDSSDVARGLNFYHPNEHFNSLLGCPINGSWYVEVVDAWSGDNGYMFDWELSLNTTRVIPACVITERDVIGDSIRKVNDSLFFAYAPRFTSDDSLVSYFVHLDGEGCDFHDTVVLIHYYDKIRTTLVDTLCDGDTARVAGLTFVRDTIIVDTLPSWLGCDSVINIRLFFAPNFDLPDSLPFCPGEPLTYMGAVYPHTIAFDTLLTTQYGCDSLVHVKLQLLDSIFAVGMLVGDSTSWSGDTTLIGCPPFLVYLRDTTPMAAQWQWELGDGDTVMGNDLIAHTYDTSGYFTPWLKVQSVNGCRDSAKIDSAVLVFLKPTARFDWVEKYPGIHKPETQFRNLSVPDSLTYLWEIQSLGTTGYDTTSAINPFYNWSNGTDIVPAGTYEVRLIAYWTQYGPDSLQLICTDTVTDSVVIINTFLEFPNMVTPDGDGYNDRWEVVNLVETGIYTMNEVWIYNHWGAQVFHARDMAHSEDFWDPNKTNSPDGTYYFRFTARSRYGIVKRNGTIEVMRGNR